MKYRDNRSDDIVEAIQFTGNNWFTIAEFRRKYWMRSGEMVLDDGFHNLVIDKNDWIVWSGGTAKKYGSDAFARRFTESA